MLDIIETEVFVSKLKMFTIIVLPIFINISSKLELLIPSLDLNKFPELICVYKTHPYNIFLVPRDLAVGVLGVCLGLRALLM